MELDFFSKWTQPLESKSSLALSVPPKSDTGPRNKSDGIQPRITRRMAKLKDHSEIACGKCVICLGNYMDDYGKLSCGHMFCLECVKQWWSMHQTCPFCRQEIFYIQVKNGVPVKKQDLPKVEKSEKDEDFIPYCELCWGSIENYQEMNICTTCRSVYWHRRCLPFRNSKWYCIECAPEETEQGNHQ